jgi:hypothetical protein
MNIALAFAFSLAAGTAQAPAPPAAPSGVDPRWAPWLGCWQGHDTEGLPVGSRVCIVAGEGTGVRLLWLDGDVPSAEESLVADGASRPVKDPDCAGTEATEWARAKGRVYRKAALTCDGVKRSVTSFWFPTRGRAWIEVLAVDAQGARNVRVRRYDLAADQRLPDGPVVPRTAGRAAGLAWGANDAGWSVDDVIEASAKLPDDVVQAALMQLDGPIPLSGRSLVAMGDAGVAESVIDLMVAMSHPGRFQVHRAGGSPAGGFSEWSESSDSVFWPMWPSVGLFGLSPYWGWGSCSAFYGCGGYYPYYPGDGWVVVQPGPPGSGAGRTEGRVINGLGYTQVTVRAPEPGPHSVGTASGGGVSSGSSASGTGSQASPGGYSGGSTGGDRTAQPR